jgi:hypothetical protein
LFSACLGRKWASLKATSFFDPRDSKVNATHQKDRKLIMEFWAVVGLACLDHVFLHQLRAAGEESEDVVREYGFRLSRWEMGELKRIMSIPGLPDTMHSICTSSWEDSFSPKDAAPCWWSAERSAEHNSRDHEQYVHPLENGYPVPKAENRHSAQKDHSSEHDHTRRTDSVSQRGYMFLVP